MDKSLVGAKWQFAHDGLDDFRDGLPPNVEGSIMVKVSNTICRANIKGFVLIVNQVVRTGNLIV